MEETGEMLDLMMKTKDNTRYYLNDINDKRDDEWCDDEGWVPAYDDEDQAELLQGGGGDVDHGEDQVAEGDGGADQTLEEDREGAGETQSSGVYYYFLLSHISHPSSC